MSSGTFSQIYIQLIFVVKGRENFLRKSFREEVFKYMSGIVTGKGQKSIIINGVEDHVHLFIGLKQERHHQKRSFKEEYIELLQKFKIKYKDEFLFDFMEE